MKKTYPKIGDLLKNGASTYNKSLKEILQLEKTNKLIIIAPESIGNRKTLSQDKKELKKFYFMGKEVTSILINNKSFYK